MKEDNYKEKFYPEILKHGNLKQALKVEFEKIGSELKDKNSGLNNYPEIKIKQKSANAGAALYERLFLCQFFCYGHCLAVGKTTSLKDVAIAMHNWLILDFKTSDLVRGSDFIDPGEKSKPFENGNFVEWNWQNYEKFIEKQYPELVSLFQTAKKNQKLKEHIIFTSHNRLGFSNCKIGHICFDILVTPLSAEQFRISLKDEKEILGDYIAEKAIQIIEENIRNECRACNKSNKKP